MERAPRPVIALQVGDTWMEPFAGARMQDLTERDFPGLHRYVDTRGIPALVDAIVQKVRERNRLVAERANVLVTAGATSGLSCAISALAETPESRALVRTIVQLGRDLGLTTLAEGIETAEQVDLLRGDEVNNAQGFLLARPLDPDTIERTILFATLADQSGA